MQNIICQLLSLYIIVLFGRVILSWFPLSPGSAMASVYSFLYAATEPVLGPVRRMLPPMGGLDLSPLVVTFGVIFLQSAICS